MRDSSKEIVVVWSFIAVAITGILLGLRFRAPALLAATIVTIGASVIASGIDGFFDRHILLSTLLLVVTLQCAYLTGLLAAVLWRRTTINDR
jgi:hypothetical protein